MTTDVAERQEAKTETEASTAVETESLNTQATDNQAQETQTDTGTERETTEGESTSKPDGRATRLSALADAERQEAEERGAERVRAELTGTTPEAVKEATKRKLQQAFPQAVARIDKVFEAAKDEYGTPRPLNAVEQTEVKNAFAAYNLVAATAAEDQVATVVQQVAYGKLSPADQAELTRRTADATDLPTYLDHWVELAAMSTKAVKTMDLETAMKTSSKLKREILARDVEHFDEGRNQGRSDPAGTSPDAGKEGRSAPANKTFIELEDKYGRGETTEAETREYERLRDARAKSR